MSKSKGNTIEPGVLIDQGYGADAVRIMELFLGPWDQSVNWSIEGMGGAYRFLQRMWTLVQEFSESESESYAGTDKSDELMRATHKTLKKVTEDIETMSFNTAIAALMELTNELFRIKAADKYQAAEWKQILELQVRMLAPFAPHISEEMWQQLGHDTSVHVSGWPVRDVKYLVETTRTIVVQINGKLRAEIQVATDADEAAVVAAAKEHEKVIAHLQDKSLRKTVYVTGRLVNFVV
jgi:leucyl-tRNA synthetase